MDPITATVTLLTQGWPLAAVIVAFLFRKQVAASFSDMTRRLKKAGPVEFDPPLQQAALPPTTAATEAQKTAAIVVATVPSPIIERAEQELLNWINSIEEPARITTLIRALAFANLRSGFERLYGEIFGSQLAALRKLNSQALDTSEFRSFYEAASSVEIYRNDYDSISFEQWASFMEASGLVARQGTLYVITEYGREFITFMVQSGRSEFKSH